MTTQTLNLDELKKKKLKEVLKNVLNKQLVLTIKLPNGDEVVIQPKPRLKPLPILEGYVPEGWKEALYQ